jgi:hypothetical protein
MNFGPTLNGKGDPAAGFCLEGIWLPRFLFGFVVLACGGDVTSNAAEGAWSSTDETQLSEESLQRDWQQVANPTLAADSKVISTSMGWYSLSNRVFGADAKAITGFESYLYHSEDGVHWRLVELPQGGPATSDPGDDLVLGDMAFANGRLVLVGSWAYNVGIVLVSSNGVEFEHFEIDGRSPSLLQSVTYAGDTFFAFSVPEGFASRDGRSWTSLAFGGSFLPNAVTFGNAVHLVAGIGGLRLSADAESWQSVAIDCALSSACISDPDGHSQNILRTAIFADGAFYVNSLQSFDGIAWQTNKGATPVQRVGDYNFATDDEGWVAWKAGAAPVRVNVRPFPLDERGTPINPGLLVDTRVVPSAPPAPEDVTFDVEGGSNCLTSRCLVLAGQLYIMR